MDDHTKRNLIDEMFKHGPDDIPLSASNSISSDYWDLAYKNYRFSVTGSPYAEDPEPPKPRMILIIENTGNPDGKRLHYLDDPERVEKIRKHQQSLRDLS